MKVAVPAADAVEQLELDRPWQTLEEARAERVLVEAGAVRGRRMPSWPSLQTDLRNAGAEWADEEVVVDGGLVTSRNPDDLDAFGAALVEEFARDRDEEPADANA